MADHDRILDGLLDRCGQTYAAEAGIRLADTPGPLYQLHVLTTLLSARISAGIAVAAARELFERLPKPGGDGPDELAGPG